MMMDGRGAACRREEDGACFIDGWSPCVGCSGTTDFDFSLALPCCRLFKFGVIPTSARVLFSQLQSVQFPEMPSLFARANGEEPTAFPTEGRPGSSDAATTTGVSACLERESLSCLLYLSRTFLIDT